MFILTKGNSPVEAKRKRTEPTPEPDENNYMDVDEMNIIMGRKRCCCGSEQEVNHELNAIRKELLKLDSHRKWLGHIKRLVYV